MLAPGGTRLATEIFAGLTLAALVLPLNVGYAEAAGLPAIVGINAAILPVIAFVLFSGSRNFVTGPDATVAALLGSTLPAIAAESGAVPEELALGVALLTGAFLLLAWLLNAGSIVRFISKSVLVGFLAGLGIEILTSQVEKILGITVDSGGWLTDVAEIVTSIPDASAPSVAVGVSTIVLLRLGKLYTPKLPAPLIALVVVGGAVYLLQPDGVAVLGEIPSGLPGLSFPTLDVSTWLNLLGISAGIAVLTLAEGTLLVKSYAQRHGGEQPSCLGIDQLDRLASDDRSELVVELHVVVVDRVEQQPCLGPELHLRGIVDLGHTPGRARPQGHSRGADASCVGQFAAHPTRCR